MAGLQITAPQRADAHTHQLLDAQPQAGKHLAHLAFQPLVQHHAGAAGAQAGHILGFGLPLGNTHTLEQLNQHATVKGLVQRYPVLFLNAALGVADALAECAVVGENQQALTVGIQAAYVVGIAVFCRQQIIHGADGALCISAAYVATRLVEQYHYLFLGCGMAAVYLHKVCGQYSQPGGVYGFAVHFYSPLGNQSVGRTAGFIAARGQKLVEAHAALRGRRVCVLFCHGVNSMGALARVCKISIRSLAVLHREAPENVVCTPSVMEGRRERHQASNLVLGRPMGL